MSKLCESLCRTNKFVGAVIFAFVLIACQPSESDVATAIAETEAAKPTSTVEPTETPIPFSDFDLEHLLVQPGDLPAGYSAAQIRTDVTEPGYEPPADDPDYYIRQQLGSNGENAGAAEVWIYENLDAVAQAYQSQEDSLRDLGDGGGEEIEGLGEKAFGVQEDTLVLLTGDTYVFLTFVRCHLVAEVSLVGNVSLESAIAYAMRLDSRLMDLVCG